MNQSDSNLLLKFEKGLGARFKETERSVLTTVRKYKDFGMEIPEALNSGATDASPQTIWTDACRHFPGVQLLTSVHMCESNYSAICIVASILTKIERVFPTDSSGSNGPAKNSLTPPQINEASVLAIAWAVGMMSGKCSEER